MSAGHMLDKTEPLTIESEFYEISHDDEYAAIEGVAIEAHSNDYDYPVSVSATTKDGREIGLVLTRKDLKRLVGEAWIAGIF